MPRPPGSVSSSRFHPTAVPPGIHRVLVLLSPRVGGGLGLGGYGSDDEDGRPKASELESTGEAATVEVAVSAEDDHDDGELGTGTHSPTLFPPPTLRAGVDKLSLVSSKSPLHADPATTVLHIWHH